MSTGRCGSRARHRAALVATALAAAAGPADAAAQIGVHLGVGARSATTLVHDSIVVPIDVRQRVGPAVTLSATLPLDSVWTGTLTVDLGWGTLARETPGTPSADLGTARTIAAALTLHRPLRAGLHGGIGIGILGYGAGRHGVFSRGGPGLTPLAAALLRYESEGSGWRRFALEARYDVHRFITPALRDVGFTAARPVHRLAIVLTAQLAGAGR